MQTAQITIVANVGQDPEQRTTNGGTQLVKFTAAVNQKQGDKEWTNWYAISAFGRLSSTLMDLHQRGIFGKGSSVVVIGRFAARPYTDKDGNERTSLDITANDVILTGGADAGEKPLPSSRDAVRVGGDDDESIPF